MRGHHPKTVPPSVVARIISLHRAGKSCNEIGKALKINKCTAAKYIKRHADHAGARVSAETDPPLGGAAVSNVPAVALEGRGAPVDSELEGKILDRMDVDQSVEVLKFNKPLTPVEIMRRCGLDPKRWVPKYYRPNWWQGFYKLKHFLPDDVLQDIVERVKNGARFREIKKLLGDKQHGHRTVQLCQTRMVFERIMTETIESAILEFVREKVPALPKPKLGPRRDPEDGYAVSWGLWDAHIGMYAWQSEVGADFDVDIARKRIFNSIDDMVRELKGYKIGKIWMPIGNDFMHFDNARMRTTFGEHYLDTDTRYGRVYLAALQCLVYMVQRATEICDHVDLLYVPGNHDLTTSFTLTVALSQRFRNDPRVHADLSFNPRKYRTHGGVILGFDHGADCQPNQYALIFGTEAKEHWSSSTYREVQIGDKHQRWEKQYEGVIPTNGIIVRRHPSLCNVDVWHHKQGLIGEPVKSVEAWRYDRVGCRGSHCVWARDDDNAKIPKVTIIK